MDGGGGGDDEDTTDLESGAFGRGTRLEDDEDGGASDDREDDEDGDEEDEEDEEDSGRCESDDDDEDEDGSTKDGTNNAGSHCSPCPLMTASAPDSLCTSNKRRMGEWLRSENERQRQRHRERRRPETINDICPAIDVAVRNNRHLNQWRLLHRPHHAPVGCGSAALRSRSCMQCDHLHRCTANVRG